MHRRSKIIISAALITTFLATPGLAQDVPSSSADEVENEDNEILVTAQFRAQRYAEVPATIGIFSGKDLDRLGADGFEDYLFQVPTASFRDQGNGSNRIALRGVSNVQGSDLGTGGTTSTVAVYLNDIAVTGTDQLPNLALYDLARIEVLKGPQGTLYGEGSLGGTVRMITNRPDASAFAASGDGTVSFTHGGGTNYRSRAMINIPVMNDVLALRVVGTYEKRDGFVDNTTLDLNNTNKIERYHVRAMLGAQLSDRFSMDLMYVREGNDAEDFPSVTIGAPDLTLRGFSEDRLSYKDSNILSATIKYNLGAAEFSAITGYSTYKRTYTDYNAFVTTLLNRRATFTGIARPTLVGGGPFSVKSDVKTFSQELRLISSGDTRFKYVLGGYFRNRINRPFQESQFDARDVNAINNYLALTDPIVSANAVAAASQGVFAGGPLAESILIPGFGVAYARDDYERFRQYAAFGDFTYELVDKLTLGFGIRYYNEDYLARSVIPAKSFGGLYASPATQVAVPQSGTVLKFAADYQISSDHLVYASASQGFRSGGQNRTYAQGVGDPGFKSDGLWQYELGAKTAWLGDALIINLAGFLIDWTDIQGIQRETSRTIPGLQFDFFGNGGNARIFGFEGTVNVKLSDNLKLGGNFGYMDAELTKVRPGATLVAGSQLPNSPKWTTSWFGEYNFRAFTAHDGYVRLSLDYVGPQEAFFKSTLNPNLRRHLPGFALVGFNVGVNVNEQVSVSLFADNLFDKRAFIGLGRTQGNIVNDVTFATVNQPRTIGITLGAAF